MSKRSISGGDGGRGKEMKLETSETHRMLQHDRREATLAEACFREVSFRGDAHKLLHKRIVELRRSVRSSTHYSPYAALIQSSGCGKSRTVMEMSSLGVYICYCSLAPRGSSAYPRRTPHLADKLHTSCDEITTTLYLKAWLVVLVAHIARGQSNPDQWKRMQLDGDKLHKEVSETWDELVATEGVVVGDDHDKVNEELLRPVVAQLREQLGKGMARVIFVLDEARGLQETADLSVLVHQSPFYQMRRSLRVFLKKPLFFALMLDTSAIVCNMLPLRSLENSARALVIGIMLLPPLYQLSRQQFGVPVPGKSFEVYTLPSTWMRYGRPLWGARMDRDDGNETKALDFAGQKLLGVVTGDFEGQKVSVASGKMTQSQAMALLGAAAGLSICSRSLLAQTMVATHMNVVLRMTEDRSMMFVTFPTEPILAEAAATYLCSAAVQEAALIHMEAACMAGYVTPGPRGEFVARFILVAAIWHLGLDEENYFLRPIPLADYLGALLAADTNEDLEGGDATFVRLKSRLPEDAVVFFNSFAAVRTPPDAAVLGNCFAGGHAIMYNADNNLPGADLIIPVWTPRGMTAVVVSVKNLGRPGWLETVSVDKLKSEFTEVSVEAKLPVVTILMSLREPCVRNAEDWVLWEDVNSSNDGHTHITCYGVDANYRFLDKKAKEMLKKVLVTVPNAYAGASEYERNWIKSVLPWEFDMPDERFAHF